MRTKRSAATTIFVILAILLLLVGGGLGVYGMYKLNWNYKALSPLFVILAILLLLVGGGLGVYGMYKLNWNYKALSPFEKGEIAESILSADEAANITTVHIDTIFHEIKFVKSDTDKIVIKYDTVRSKDTGSVFNTLAVNIEDNVLSLNELDTTRKESNKYMFADLGIHLYAEIMIPGGTVLDYEFDTAYEDIYFDSLDIGSLTLKTCYDKVSLTNVTINGNIKTGDGESHYIDTVNISDSVLLEPIEISIGSGDINITRTDVRDTLKCVVHSGTIRLNTVNLTDADIKSSSGNCDLDKVTASGRITGNVTGGNFSASNITAAALGVRSVSGNIKLEELDVPEVSAQAASGNIDVNSELKQAAFTCAAGNITMHIDGKKDEYTREQNSSIKNPGKDKYIKVQIGSGNVSWYFND